MTKGEVGALNCVHGQMAFDGILAPVLATCSHCGASFERVPGGVGRPQAFCAATCRKVHAVEQRRQWATAHRRRAELRAVNSGVRPVDTNTVDGLALMTVIATHAHQLDWGRASRPPSTGTGDHTGQRSKAAKGSGSFAPFTASSKAS